MFCVLAQTAWGQDGYVVQGRVVYSDNLPGSSMEVSLSVDGLNRTVGPVLSDQDGHFRIENAPPGTYTLFAWNRAQGLYVWNQSALTDGSHYVTSVTVGPESPTADVIFRIDRHATVYGVVTDPNGDPLPGVDVYALRRVWAFGRPYLASASLRRSDYEGAFRLWDLPRGRYRICAVQNSNATPLGMADLDGKGPALADVGECPEGPFIEIRPGEERRIDLKVREVPAAPVLLRMRGPASEFPLIEFVPKDPPDETRTLFNTAFGAHQYRAGETYSDSIPAGSYWLRATSFNRTYGGKAAVSISLKRPNIVDLQLGAMPVVDLDVSVPPGYEKRRVRVGFHDADDPGSSIIDPSTQLTSGAPTDPAKIRFPYPGRYWLAARTELCASAASAGEVDLLNQPLTVKVDQTITVHIRFEKTCASIRGHITSKSAAVPRARLAILVSGSPKDPGDVYVATAGEMGEYYLTGLNAGTYRMWCWRPEDEESGAIGSLAEIARKAHRVQVKPGQLKSIDIRILKVKKRPVK